MSNTNNIKISNGGRNVCAYPPGGGRGGEGGLECANFCQEVLRVYVVLVCNVQHQHRYWSNVDVV